MREIGSGVDRWTEDEAMQRWMADLEAEEAAAELVRGRLEKPPLEAASAREEAYRSAAARWLDRGQARVALALLDRSASPPVAIGAVAPPTLGSVAADLEVMMASRPGTAGLPALTADEVTALRAAPDPEEALVVLRRARARLEAHGQEARTLLRRWLARERRGGGTAPQE